MPQDLHSNRLPLGAGWLTACLGFGWCLALFAHWNEIAGLASTGFLQATASVLCHQVLRWTAVALLLGGLWIVAFSLLTARATPRVASVLASTLAISPWLIWSVYDSSLREGVYFGNFLSSGFIGFLLDSGARALLLWVVAIVAIEIWRRRVAAAGTRSLGTIALVLAGATALLWLAAGGSESRASGGRPPDVILIVVDALRPDHLGTYGYSRPTSPNIDELAEQGLQFETAISQSTLTKTSIASLFTGLNPHRHGVYSGHRLTDGRLYSDTLADSLPTLASELRANGYITAAWLQQSQLKAASGYGRGFLFYNENSRDIATINRRFLSWMRRIGRSAPVFAYLHYIDLHDPYRPAPPYETLYGETANVRAKLDESRWKKTLESIQTGLVELTPTDVDELVNLYDGQLTFIDEHLGRLFASLRDMGDFDDTLIILTSDHGDGFMEHGFISHSVKPYDELIKVPLIVRLPGAELAGKRIARQVRLIDVMPSILDWTDSALPDGLDGQSLGGSIEAGQVEPLAISEVEMRGDGGYEYFASIRSRDFKVIGNSEGPLELYDLDSDPGEKLNLLPETTSAPSGLIQALRAVSKARQQLKVDQVPLDERTEDELRALGYIE